MDIIFSIILWIIGLVLGIPLVLTFIIVFVPWLGFTQFYNTDIKDVEEKIFKNQLKQLQKVTGMTLPPYVARFREPVTDLNGSFYGMIYIEFKELLKEDYWMELEKRIKDADPYSLWVDRKLATSIILNLDKDKHYIHLGYSRIYPEGSKHGAFCIHDNRNVQPLDIKDTKEMFGDFGVSNIFRKARY